MGGAGEGEDPLMRVELSPVRAGPIFLTLGADVVGSGPALGRRTEGPGTCQGETSQLPAGPTGSLPGGGDRLHQDGGEGVHAHRHHLSDRSPAASAGYSSRGRLVNISVMLPTVAPRGQ